MPTTDYEGLEEKQRKEESHILYISLQFSHFVLSNIDAGPSLIHLPVLQDYSSYSPRGSKWLLCKLESWR